MIQEEWFKNFFDKLAAILEKTSFAEFLPGFKSMKHSKNEFSLKEIS